MIINAATCLLVTIIVYAFEWEGMMGTQGIGEEFGGGR